MSRELVIREPEPLPQATLEGVGRANIPTTIANAGEGCQWCQFYFREKLNDTNFF